MKQLIYIICGLCAISSFGQSSVNTIFNLSEIAMLDLKPNNSTVTLSLATNEAGEKAAIVTSNNKKWLNFSSAVIAGKSRNISIHITDGQVPSGIYLKLSTSNVMGNGLGLRGTSVQVLTLNNTSQTLISNIRGAYTGNGIGNGYELTYNLEIFDYKLLDFNQSATLTITLTLSDSL